MDFLETLAARNADFAADGFVNGLKMLPSMRTLIIGCVDPRVEPADLFELESGEALVIRNIGGRINRALLETLEILQTVAGVAGKSIGEGWNLIVLHHTDCGIKPCLTHAPQLLEKYFDVDATALDGLAINDPYASVAVDVAALKANPKLPGGFLVTGLVYDVDTGRVQTVVPSALLRPEAQA